MTKAERSRRYDQRHKEQRRQYWSDYYRHNRDEILATKRVKAAMWRERNRPIIRVAHKLKVTIPEARRLIEASKAHPGLDVVVAARSHRSRQRAAIEREARRRHEGTSK